MERVNVAEKSLQSAERFTKQICFNDPHVLVFTLTFSPGQALPPHRHPGSTVVLQVWTGAGVVITDGREAPVAKGDILLVGGEEELAVRNTGTEALVLLASLSPNPTNPAYAREIK